MNEINNTSRPDRVDGIPVQQTTPAIHFLTGLGWGYSFKEKDTVIASFVMHYEDGTSETFPLRFITDVGDWERCVDAAAGREQDRLARARTRWRGWHPSAR